jgi:hypothetical protein
MLPAASGSPPPAASTPPTFGQPTISGIQGFGYEQNIRLDPTSPDRVYTSVPDSGSSDTSWIWHSEDAGRTFKWVPAAQPTQGKVTTCPGGGDTELAVDTAGHLYFADLHLDNFSTARSDDYGTSFTCSPTGVPDAVVDRQWYATDGDPTNGGNLYLTSNEVGRDQPVCGSSNEGNNILVVYRSPAAGAGAIAGIEFGPAFQVTAPASCGEGIMGNIEVSPRTHHVFVIHDNAFLDAIAIARCVTVAFGAPLPAVSDPSGLNCTDIPVASFRHYASGSPAYKTAGNFPNMAIDTNGNLYAVWEQAPIEDGTGYVIGDTVLKYSYSTDDGSTWSTPITIPTPGLHNNVYAWPAAGDDGRVDIAWYGTPDTAKDSDPVCGRNPDPFARVGNTGTPLGGPDAVTNGIWSVYMVQTLNGHARTPTFTTPILAGEHYVHKGSIQTIIGGLCGNRTLGDFLQMRIGSKGEAQIAYGDSNSLPGSIATPHAMYVRQNGGTGLFATSSPVVGDAILINSATDRSGDGRLEAGGTTSDNFPNLDILDSSMSKPAPSDCHPSGTPCYRVKMTINNLGLAIPSGLPTSDGAIKWLTQWLVPADPACTDATLQGACPTGGKNFFVYAEWDGSAATCWSGETAAQQSPGPTTTYPGLSQISSPGACSLATGPNATITIEVPISQVTLQATAPFSDTLYTVTASTMSLGAPDELPPPFLGVGGIPFNLIDVVRAYDAKFAPPALALAPKTQTVRVGKQACVTAAVTTSGSPAGGVTVRFSVTGTNKASGSKSTDASGQAKFCYDGRKTGVDSITAYADFNANNVQDPTDPGDTASAMWTKS